MTPEANAATGPAGATPETSTAGRAIAAGVCLLALCSVSPLLAWVYGLGRFSTWAAVLGGPAVLVVAVIAALAKRTPVLTRLGPMIAVGAVAGLIGTIGYDLFRVPFALFGLRLLAPIDSYGVLLLDARASNALTGFTGWSYHFTNGICFGIAYALVGWRRSLWWGLVWAMVLETATVVTPFSESYGLRGKWLLVGIAYAAHVPYGLALGRLVERGDTTISQMREISRRTPLYSIVALVAVLLVWHRPLPPYTTRAEVTIRDGKFHPLWVRVSEGGCARFENADTRDYLLKKADGKPEVVGDSAREVCFSDDGVHRVKTTSKPRSGGFVIVDPELDA